MPLESATYISDLDPSNPVGSVDLVSSLDDHMRLVKATLQTTFPGIAGAVTATHVELNHLDGVTGTTGTGKLVLDDAPTITDLTVTDSITLPAASVADAALSSNVPKKDANNLFTATGAGRSSAAIRIAADGPWIRFTEADQSEDAQDWLVGSRDGAFAIGPVSDNGTSLTAANLAIAIGRSGATLDSIAIGNSTTSPAISLNGVDAADFARKSQSNTFEAHQVLANNVVLRGLDTQEGAHWMVGLGNDDEIYFGGSSAGLDVNILGGNVSVSTVGTFSVSGAALVPTIANSTSTTLVVGQVHAVTGNATLPNMAAGQWVGVVNNSASPITVTKNASDTMYWTASGSSVASVTVAARGKATFFCADSTNVYASGNITGSS